MASSLLDYLLQFLCVQCEMVSSVKKLGPALKGKFDRCSDFRFFDFGLFSCHVDRIPIDINCLVRNSRTCELTVTASYADILVGFRDYKVPLIGDHIDCLCGACFRTGSAGCLFSLDDAVILNEIDLAYLS